MTRLNRWLRPLAFLVLAAALILPAPVRAAGPFAAFLLEADAMDFPELALQVDLYVPDESGQFQPNTPVRYSCQINRLAGDAELQIQPQSEGVWVAVDYLVDRDLDGIYEMLTGETSPLCDSMDKRGRLTLFSKKGVQPLSAGTTYALTDDTLAARGKAARKAVNAPETAPLLYLVSLRQKQADGTVAEQCYYIQLNDKVLPPLDVPATANYYFDVIYAMERGFLSGTGENTFSPDLELTRAQLAQILWSISGAPSAQDMGYTDVTSSHWFYKSASWCSEVGLMAGVGGGLFSPDTKLTWEQLSLILMQYTRHIGEKYDQRGDLSGYADASSVSFWAQESMAWAVANGLIPIRADNTLRPQSSITRAELSTVLHTYCTAYDI